MVGKQAKTKGEKEMGTRSLTVFVDTDGETEQEIAVLYRQFDGYPSGHGLDLCEFLSGMTIVNGLNGQKRVANGMPCLAAQVVAHFKTEAGHFYLYPAGTRDTGEEYTYTVYGKEGEEPQVKCMDYDGVELFNGPASKVVKKCKD
jgi:hypothetical protein